MAKQQIRHWAIYGSGLSMGSEFIQDLLKGKAPDPFRFLTGKTGALYSNYTLNQFIKEESIHDDYSLSEQKHRSIRTFSSGEQRKALLNHLLLKNPDFLILDNVFDMLDKESQKHLLVRLSELSEKIMVIQVFRRKSDILPFIGNVVRLDDNEQLVFSGTLDRYNKNFRLKAYTLEGNIPAAPSETERMDDPFIDFRNITVEYGERCILKNINWEIKQGDFWQLMGPNGSGKTTLLTMLTGENPKAYGQDLTIFGKKKGSGESVWEIKKKIGYVTPAMTVLFKGRHTVENMIVSGLHDSIGLYQQPTFFEKELANEWIDLIGLSDLKDKWFADISEGQQCMVLIARSMIKHPPLLVLDEPTHGLDDYNVSVLTALVNKIAAESQTTIIYVSHKTEKGLCPTNKFKLVPGEGGSKGIIHRDD